VGFPETNHDCFPVRSKANITAAPPAAASVVAEIGTTVRAARDDARRDVFAYLGYYNHDSLHSTLDYRTPHEVHVGYRQGLTLVA
jgi:transposase InsO family protein